MDSRIWNCGNPLPIAAIHMGASYSFAVTFLSQFPASGLGKTMEDGPSIWASATHVWELAEAPEFWLQSSLALTVAQFQKYLADKGSFHLSLSTFK